MEKRLTADLNVVANSNLEIQLLDGDLNIIQKLDDEPNDVGGLTSAELKAKFDESGNIIKKYINETLIPAVLTEDATEESRKQAEAARVAAEQGRVTAEEGRVSAETARAQAETVRQSAETARSGAESTRQSKETARQTAETARANAETDRQAAETRRGEAETARASAESERRNAESSRATAEGGRASAEASRVTAEQGRTSAESIRVQDEQKRVSAENSRVEAEAQRAAAEQARADENTGIVAQATAQANAAAQSAGIASASAQTAQSAASSAGTAASTASSAAAAASGSASNAAGSAAAAVTAHNVDASAHADIREVLAKAGSLVIHANVVINSETGEPKITLDKTYAEIANAFNSGRNAVIVLSGKDGDYDIEQLFELTGAFAEPTINGTVTYYRFEHAVTDNTMVTFGAIEVGGDDDIELYTKKVPTLSDYRPRPPGNEASPGTDLYAARSDHVHPREVSDDDRTAWNGKASKPTVTTVTLTAASWNATTKKQTATVPGVLADPSKQVIWVTQTTEAAIDAYLEAGIVPVAQAVNAVTLRADTVPTADIMVNIVVQEVQ